MPHWMQIELLAIWLVVFVFVGWLAMLSDKASTGIVDRESVGFGVVLGLLVATSVAVAIAAIQSLVMFIFGWIPQ